MDEKFLFLAKCVVINDKNEFLILKRTNYKNDGTEDLWDFPGGGVDLGENVNNTIKREVLEEAGIEMNSFEVLNIDSGISRSGKQFIFVLYYSTNYDFIERKVILSEEHSEFKWISKEEIKNYNFYMEDYRLETIKEHLINS